jgi:DNA-binding CsgD family transcriptional regulator
MRLAEMSHFVNDLISEIETTDLKDNSIIEDLKKSLNLKILGSTWKQFNDSFLKTHPDFERSLVQKHPAISPAEVKLAALLRLNLNTKEISAILNLSPDGIKVSRSRLRKKLQIESDANLTGYLMHF